MAILQEVEMVNQLLRVPESVNWAMRWRASIHSHIISGISVVGCRTILSFAREEAFGTSIVRMVRAKVALTDS